MAEHDDIMFDLFNAIEAVPVAPDLEEQSPLDVAAFGTALELSAALLTEAATRWATNARVALPDWENHYDKQIGRNQNANR